MKMKSTYLFTALVLLGVVIKSSGQVNSNTVVSANAPGTPSERNVLVGQDAGASLTTQTRGLNGDNVFVGFNSGMNSNSAPSGENSRNTFVGTFSGFGNTTGSDNIFLGFGSGRLNTTGEKNIFIKSLRENTNTSGIPMTGIGNTMIGYQTGDFMQSGSNNTFLGNSAGRFNTTGNYNLFLGYGAGYGNLTGNQNICLGIGANQNAPDGGSNNVYIGSYAGRHNNGLQNTLLGFNSGQNLLTGTANTFLGYVQVPLAPSTDVSAGSDTKSSIILADGNGNQRLFIHRNGNTGIGLGNNVLPVNKLDVKGGAVIGENYTARLLPTPVVGAVAPTNGLLVEGKVGIGNTLPKNKLEITHGTDGNSGLRFTNLTSDYNPPATATDVTKFLSVNATGDVVLQKIPNASVTNALSSNGNSMTSNVNEISVSAPIVNSISNSINSVNQLVTTVNGVASSPITLPIPTQIDNSPTNELQTLSQSGNTITLSNGGGSFTLPTFTQVPQTLTQTGNVVSLSNGGGSFTLPTFNDTDSQSLSLTGNNLSISNGNTVTLPIPTPQTLTQTGNTISLSNGGGSFTLPTLNDTDAQTLSITGNTLTISNGNSVQLPVHGNQTITQNGAIVTLSNGGGSFTDSDSQNLTLTGNTLSISNGNTVTLPTTNIVAGTNVTINGTGTAATPYVISATDKSIYANNGTINQASTTNGNRIVTMNDSNIWFKSATTDTNGKIYIGTTATYPTTTGNYKLFVEGGILTEKVKVALRSTANWADYVFDEKYKLMPLKEVEQFVNVNKHLPGIDSAAALADKGIDVAEMQSKQMEKIEELTLYAIDQDKKIEVQQQAIENQNKEIEALKMQVKMLIEKTK